MSDYVKVYCSHYNIKHKDFPRDNEGRKYEVHHINGNHSDNRIENLKLVSIQEHYDIHYSQGDYNACQAITRRMRLTPEEHSRLCSELAKNRVENGTHPLAGEAGSKHATALARKRVENGTHPWAGEAGSRLASELNKKRVENGTNPLAGDAGSRLARRRIENGTHNLAGDVGSRLARRRVENGTHNLLKENRPKYLVMEGPKKGKVYYASHCAHNVGPHWKSIVIQIS